MSGYQGSEEDADKIALTGKPLQAVLAEARVVCGAAVAHCGRLNADPGVTPCLAKEIASARFIDFAFAHSFGAGKELEATCRFRLDDCAGTRRDFVVACPNVLASSVACQVTDRWFSPHFSILTEFNVRQWVAEVACPCASQPIWPACWVDTPDKSSSSSSTVVQNIWGRVVLFLQISS